MSLHQRWRLVQEWREVAKGTGDSRTFIRGSHDGFRSQELSQEARIGHRGAAMLSEVSEGPTMVGGVLAELA